VFAQLTQYVIGGPGNEIATRIRYLPSDGSAIVAGYSYNITGGAISNAQMILVKVAASGAIAWQKSFGIAGSSNLIQDMIITHDGNIVVVGTVGRSTIYSGNVAAIMKFNAANGNLMWQKCMSATPVNTGGELYFGVTELGASKSYELVAVGGSNFYPGLSSGLIGVYQSDGTLLYNDVYNVAGTGYLNGVTQNTDSSGVYICGVFPGDFTDGSVFSYTPGTTTGTVNWSQYMDFYLDGTLQNNFLSDIYLSESKLVIEGTSGKDYSPTLGQGQFVLTMNASDGTDQQVYGIKNNGTSFANNPKIAVVSPDHVFAIQSPYFVFYDASLWTAGFTTSTVITEITSLAGGTSNPPVRLVSGGVGEHSIFDMRLQGSSLYLAGATNAATGFGNNDIYIVIAGSSLASTNHTCDTVHDVVSITSATTTAKFPAFSSTTLTPTYYTIDTATSSFNIQILCGDTPTIVGICNILDLADSAHTCDSTTIALSANVTGVDSIINIHWTPKTGLSDTAILNPSLTVGTASGYYYLTVVSLPPGNLVFNGDFSDGDTAFTSAYPYVSGSGSLEPEGVFAITTDPHLDHPGAASFGDHTTGTGNMMAINGASAPIDVWCQTISVTPNTYYDFSAWFANWSSDTSDNLPVIQFEINGISMGGSFSFPHADGAWTEYANSWYSGTNTFATICIHDSVTAASGNDFAIDDISFQQLCVATDSIYISAIPKPLVDLGPDTILCSGTPISLHSSYTYTSPSFLWNTGSVATAIFPTTTNEYSLQVTVAGCSNNDSVHITFKPTPIISLGHDISLCQGDSVTLAPFIGAGDSFFWSTGATTAAINIFATGSYSIKVDSNGCSSSDTVQVTVFPLPIVALGPDITSCEGDSIILSSTGSYTSPEYMWSTGATAPSIYVSSSGNYALTISQNGCLGFDTVNVHVTPLPIVNLGNDTSICVGNQVILSSAQPANAAYLWSDGSNGSTLNVSATGSYVLTVTDSSCVATDTINIDVFTIPVVNLGPDTSLCSDEVLVLNANVTNGSLLWSTGSTDETIEVSQTGIYSVIAENVCGTVGDTISVSFYSCNIWFPSAFSPNSDGLNDIIRVRGTLFAFDDFALSIFNRWGQRVFYTENIYNGWDGKVNGTPEDIGTYFYMITYHLEGKRHMIKGDFQLIR